MPGVVAGRTADARVHPDPAADSTGRSTQYPEAVARRRLRPTRGEVAEGVADPAGSRRAVVLSRCSEEADLVASSAHCPKPAEPEPNKEYDRCPTDGEVSDHGCDGTDRTVRGEPARRVVVLRPDHRDGHHARSLLRRGDDQLSVRARHPHVHTRALPSRCETTSGSARRRFAKRTARASSTSTAFTCVRKLSLPACWPFAAMRPGWCT